MSALGLGLDVAGIAEVMLEAIVAQFDAAGVALPDRQIIAPGAPGEIAWDCPMVAICLSSIGLGATPGGAGSGSPRQGMPASVSGLRHAVLAAQLTRCEPAPKSNGKPPEADVLRAAALAYMRDAGLLSQAMVNVATEVGGGLPLGSLVQVGEVQTIGPQGGHVGLISTFTVTAGSLI